MVATAEVIYPSKSTRMELLIAPNSGRSSMLNQLSAIGYEANEFNDPWYLVSNLSERAKLVDQLPEMLLVDAGLIESHQIDKDYLTTLCERLAQHDIPLVLYASDDLTDAFACGLSAGRSGTRDTER